MNIWAIIVATIAAYAIGALWYSLLFQKQWMEITGSANKSPEEMKRMQKEAGPLYLIQLVITFLQAYVLAWFINALANESSVNVGLCIVAGFVLPTLIGAVMWTGAPRPLMKKQIAIQLGCQLVSFIAMSLILGMWK